MPRTQYETKQDLANEQKLQPRLEQLWDCELHKLPKSYKVDWGMFRNGDMVGVCEFKKRNISSTQYRTIILSLAKYMEMRMYVKAGLTAIFIVELSDGVFHWSVTEIKLGGDIVVKWGGRTVQTRDSADIEPVVHFKLTDATKVPV